MSSVAGEDSYLKLLQLTLPDEERWWLRCVICGHFSNSVRLSAAELETLYQKFRDEEWRSESPDQYFDRITSLDPASSENFQKMSLIITELGAAEGGGISNTNRRMLDIGCGGGVLLNTAKQFLDADWLFFGVEPTESFAELATRRTGASVVSDDYQHGLFDGLRFGLATCCQVLEHVSTPREFLRSIRLDLEDGGYLYLEVPDVSDFSTLENSHDRFMAQHISYFSSTLLVPLLSDTGFKIWNNGVTSTVRGRNNLWIIAQAA